MNKPKIKIDVNQIAFQVALFYLASRYEDVFARDIFWWLQIISVGVGIFALILLLFAERPFSVIHPVTSAFSVITAIGVAWMTWALGFYWLFWGYAIVSFLCFIVTIPYIRAE